MGAETYQQTATGTARAWSHHPGSPSWARWCSSQSRWTRAAGGSAPARWRCSALRWSWRPRTGCPLCSRQTSGQSARDRVRIPPSSARPRGTGQGARRRGPAACPRPFRRAPRPWLVLAGAPGRDPRLRRRWRRPGTHWQSRRRALPWGCPEGTWPGSPAAGWRPSDQRTCPSATPCPWSGWPSPPAWAGWRRSAPWCRRRPSRRVLHPLSSERHDQPAGPLSRCRGAVMGGGRVFSWLLTWRGVFRGRGLELPRPLDGHRVLRLEARVHRIRERRAIVAVLRVVVGRSHAGCREQQGCDSLHGAGWLSTRQQCVGGGGGSSLLVVVRDDRHLIPVRMPGWGQSGYLQALLAFPASSLDGPFLGAG